MRCRLSLLLMMALLWQGLTLAGLGAWFPQGAAAQQARQHWQGPALHHHHDDGRLHQDLSGASLQHAMDDTTSQAPVIPAQAPALPPVLVAQPRLMTAAPSWSSQAPDALERPPRRG